MDLTPLDIEHTTFDLAPLGYRPRSVQKFLQRVASERESLLRQARSLREKLDERASEVTELREAEAELTRAVMAAERIGSEMKENARHEADLIVARAHAEADGIRRSARKDVERAQAELARLERSQSLVREQLRGYLTAFLRALDAAPADRSVPEEAAIGEDDVPGEPDLA
jgi:cell division initiation protein